MNYLLFRYVQPVPSLLATSSCFLFLLYLTDEFPQKREKKLKYKNYLLNNLKDKDYLLKGFIIFTIFMAQPLYCSIYIILYSIFSFFLYIYREKIGAEFYRAKFFGFKDYFTKLFSFLCIVFALILPYIIGLSFYLDYLILETYIRYLIPEFDISLVRNFIKLLSENFFLINLSVSNTNYFSLLLKLYFQTIDYGLLIIIIAIFIPFNKVFKLNETQKNVLRLIKLSYIFTVFVFSLHYLFQFINVGVIRTTNNFLTVYHIRLLEMFSGFWAILFSLVFKFIFYRSKPVVKMVGLENIVQKYNLKMIPIVFIILLGGYFYIINFIRFNPTTNYSDPHTEAVQYVGNYFYINPIQENSTIILEDLGNNHIYDLIPKENLNEKFFNFTYNSTYKEFYYKTVLIPNLKFIFLNLDGLSQSFINSLSKNLTIIYKDNFNYLFAEIKNNYSYH